MRPPLRSIFYSQCATVSSNAGSKDGKDGVQGQGQRFCSYRGKFGHASCDWSKPKGRSRQDVSCQLRGDGYDVVAASHRYLLERKLGTRIESLVSNFDEQRNCVCFDPSDAHFRSSAAQRQLQPDVLNGTCGFDSKYLPRSVFKWHHQEERAESLTNSGDQGRTRRCHSWRRSVKVKCQTMMCRAQGRADARPQPPD